MPRSRFREGRSRTGPANRSTLPGCRSAPDDTRLSGTARCGARRAARGRRGRIDPTSCGSRARVARGRRCWSSPAGIRPAASRQARRTDRGRPRWCGGPGRRVPEDRAGSGRSIRPRRPRRWLDRYRRERARTCGSLERLEGRTSEALGRTWSVSAGSRSPRRWFVASGPPPSGKRTPAERSQSRVR